MNLPDVATPGVDLLWTSPPEALTNPIFLGAGPRFASNEPQVVPHSADQGGLA